MGGSTLDLPKVQGSSAIGGGHVSLEQVCFRNHAVLSHWLEAAHGNHVQTHLWISERTVWALRSQLCSLK